ncbi:MAG: Gfo/Idh/MocA family oxidoreductase [Lachnospiraceae bacterium]|nr:Gfo/Idh/MocA family oxidoreductase [Lachnospiraceae bacterium]
MKESLNWAVLGVGVIANQMAEALKKHGKKIYAVGNRTHEKAVTFAEKYGIEKVYDDPDDMFTDPNVDIIYITTPHNTHYGFMKKAIAGGKHLLVEKSITLNSDELSECLALAKEKGTLIAEAQTIYHMPLYTELAKRLSASEFGRVNLITMNFGSSKAYDMKNRFFNRSLAGGAMLDIGVYALSFIRWFFEGTPTDMQSMLKKAPTGVDEEASMLLQNNAGQLATVMLSMHSKQPKRGMVSCEKGYIEVMEYPRAQEAIFTDAVTGEKTVIAEGSTDDALWYELSDMEAAVNGDTSRLHIDYTVDVMKLMTDFRKQWGLTYPEEEG